MSRRIKEKSIKTLIKEKIKILKQLGYIDVTAEDFENVTNEIQLDNAARKIIKTLKPYSSGRTAKETAYDVIGF